MLSDKLVKAKELIEKVSVEQNLVAQYNQYSTFLTDLEGLIPQLNNYKQACQILQGYQPEEFSGIDVTGIIIQIDAILNILKKGTEPPRKNQIKQLAEEARTQEEQLKKNWKRHVIINTQDSLGVLNNIKGILDDSSKINEVIIKIEVLKSQWPVSNKTLQDLTATLEKALQIMQDLNAGEDVQKFLELVSARKARLSDLKPEILSWLQKQQLTKNLEITFASGQGRV